MASKVVETSRITAMLAGIATRQHVKFGYNKDLPDHRDRYYPSHKPLKYDAKVDLSGKIPPPYDQGELGSCTANAISGGLQFLQGLQGESSVMPSRLFIYFNERSMEGSTGSDSGAQIRDGIKSVAKVGYCSEDTWPYDISTFTEQPPEQAYVEAEKHQVLAYYRVTNREGSLLHCLASGYPVVFGIAVYESFMNAAGGQIPMPQPDEKLMGGHAMLCVGYDLGTRRFKFRNSWGTSWGDGTGHGTIPFEYLESPLLGGDYWTLRKEEIPS